MNEEEVAKSLISMLDSRDHPIPAAPGAVVVARPRAMARSHAMPRRLPSWRSDPNALAAAAAWVPVSISPDFERVLQTAHYWCWDAFALADATEVNNYARGLWFGCERTREF